MVNFRGNVVRCEYLWIFLAVRMPFLVEGIFAVPQISPKIPDGD